MDKPFQQVSEVHASLNHLKQIVRLTDAEFGQMALDNVSNEMYRLQAIEAKVIEKGIVL